MNNRRIKCFFMCSIITLMIIASIAICGCSEQKTSGGDDESSMGLPEKHFIPYDESMPTVGDDMGADSYNSSLDKKDSKYYVVVDYYNMKSDDKLHIIPEFETYQQTTEYSCGPSSAVMVLNHYDNHEYNELDICKLTGTESGGTGTSVEALAGFFEGIGWKVESNASTDFKFKEIEDAEKFIVDKIDEGTPIMVDWEDWRGHWQAIIGIDSCGTDDPYDDVLIMADPYDVTDHYQDGYFTVPFARFYEMWREGPCAKKAEPYEQPYVVATP